MEEIDFSEPVTFLLTFFFSFLGIFLRYVILALAFNSVFNGILKRRFVRKKVSFRIRKRKEFYQELFWSGVTSVIFAFSMAAMMIAWQKGWLLVYVKLNDYPIWYLFFSTGLFLFIHETYYYWLHRWMHLPKVFKIVHKVHHNSITPSVWTAFSFHPIESILQALVLPIFILFVPLHYAAIAFLLLFMTITSFINHLNIEIYPLSFLKHRIGKWMIGATHHTLHHTEFRSNYGLYFTFWDEWMGTESPNYQKLLKRLGEKDTDKLKRKEELQTNL